jgi:hypothetical protein
MPHRERPRGHATKVKTFRLPVEQVTALEKQGAWSLTDAVVLSVDLALGVRAELGEELWGEVRARAAREDAFEGQALGKVLGQLAREALEKKGGRR